MTTDLTIKQKCEKCGTEYEPYLVKKYIPELNGNDYCKTCRDFLKTKVKDNRNAKIKVKIHWSHYPLPNFEPSPDGIGYIRKKDKEAQK